MNLESGVMQIHIEDIIPNRFQPRLAFDEEGLKELSDSIKEHGIIQPLVLRKLGNKYEIIAGERRYKAATMAGLTTVPAVIANVDDNKAAEVAIVENVQRRDLTAIEEARSYKNLLDKGYLTQEQLAKRMGLSQPAIANKLRLLNLDEEVQQALLEEKISERHARTLLTLHDKEAQKEWLHRIINERLTVRQLDLEIKKLKEKQNQVNTEIDEDLEEVPLVEENRNIDEIKAQATDLRDLNKKMTSEDIMKPTEVINEELETLDLDPDEDDDESGTGLINESPKEEETYEEKKSDEEMNTFDNKEESLDDPSENNQNMNPFTVATSVPESNIITPESTSTFVQSDQIIDNNSENKFFNFNNINPIEENSSFTEVNKEDNIDNKTMEIFDAQSNQNSFEQFSPTNPFSSNTESQTQNETQKETTQENQFFANTSSLNTDFDRNPNNRFFTPVLENNIEEQRIQNSNDKIVDPMASIDKIVGESGEQKKSKEEQGLKMAISQIRKCIEDLGEKGFSINVEEIDFENEYQITLEIKKDS